MTVAPSPLPLPPGNDGLPWIGETFEFFRDRHYARKRHDQYGPIFKTRLFGRPTIFVRGSAANTLVLNNENKYFQISWPPSATALLGPLMVPLQTGAEHGQRRKLLAQAFMPRALANYLPTMQAIAQQYFDRWEAQGTLTWYSELTQYTFDVACKLLAGLDNGSQTPLGHWFELWSAGLLSLKINLPWTTFGKALKARQNLLDTLEQLIRDRQAQPPSNHDVLGLLLQAEDETGQRLSLEELKEQILVLLFAGHSTLTSAITSFCLLSAQHPDVLEKMRQEQQNFPAPEALTLEDLKQMTYLEQVLKEVMRLIPPVGGGFRRVLETCEFSGYQIPQGWSLIYQINATHKEASTYPQPDSFDPDRFSPDQTPEKQKYNYLPFGGGIRECLGKEFARLEMKLFAANLLQRYEWDLLPDQSLELITIPSPRPWDGLKVQFRKRK